MKKFLLAIVAMYILGIGPCDVLAMLRPAQKVRPRLIDIIRPREEPQPEATKPEPAKPTAAITHDARGQYIVRRGQRCYWSESRKAWREPIKGGCAGGICGYRDIKPGE